MTVPRAPSIWQQVYDPAKVTDLRVHKIDDPILQDTGLNLGCAYNLSGDIHLVTRGIPEVGPHEALVRVRATGICGSDVHFWKHGRIGTNLVTGENIAGHESAGEVVIVGSAVEGLAPGDRVAIEAGIPCGEASCSVCLLGDYKACPRMVFHSSPPFHGTMTRFIAHPAMWLHKLPANVSYEEGALCEPLCVALSGVERAGVSLGQSVLVCGAGPVGLLTLLSCLAAGATTLVISDLSETRLAFAKLLVPSVQTIQVDREWAPAETSARIKKAAGESLDVALECTGAEPSIETAIYSVKFGSKVMIIGLGPDRQSYPFGYCALNQIDVQFLFRYAHQYAKAIKLVSSGRIDMKPLVSHRFSLARGVDAFATAGDPTQGAIKVLVVDEE